MTRNSEDGYGAIEKVVNNISSPAGKLDWKQCSYFTLGSFPVFRDSETSNVSIAIEKCKADEWKIFLHSWTSAVAFFQKNGRNNEQFKDSAQESVKTQLIAPLLICVKCMIRIAASEDLWATAILSQCCCDISSLVCRIRDKSTSEEAAAAVRQAFRITVSDNENEESLQGRTLKYYDIAVCLLRIYTSLHAYPLAEGILNAVKQYSGNIPDLSQSDWRTQTQFLFYKGLFSFYDQKYHEATQSFLSAIDAAQVLNTTQVERILVFLIPSMYLATKKTPKDHVWGLSSKLRELYQPLLKACQIGDYQAYLAHLNKHGETLRRNRLFLACDSMLPQLRLNLLRRVWLILGTPKRVALHAYTDALRACRMIAADSLDNFVAEYYISQFILKGEVKGYIHHELGLLMLSKSKPFPNLVRHGTANT